MKFSIAYSLISILFCVVASQPEKVSGRGEVGVTEIPGNFSYAPIEEVICFEDTAGSLSGTVRDISGHPRERVLVERVDGGCEKHNIKRLEATHTDAKGRFSLSHVEPGTYFLRVTYSGFNQLAITVEIKEESREELSLELHPS